MNKLRFAFLILFGFILIYGNSYAELNKELLGPSPYLSFLDSPFQDINFSWFYIETFEDNQFNVPGVVAINNNPDGGPLAVYGPSEYNDSVDGDDGSIDGYGSDGHSFADSENKGGDDYGHTYKFDPKILGGYPTHVGIVWTDGSDTAPTQFEAFDEFGVSLGIIGPVYISDDSFGSETEEDRFFGAINLTAMPFP